MPVIRIPTPLRAYTAGKSETAVSGATVGDALFDLTGQYPTLKPHLYNSDGELRPYVSLLLGADNVKDLSGMQTPLQTTDRLVIIPTRSVRDEAISYKKHRA